jgi:hypothetical protein
LICIKWSCVRGTVRVLDPRAGRPRLLGRLSVAPERTGDLNHSGGDDLDADTEQEERRQPRDDAGRIFVFVEESRHVA